MEHNAHITDKCNENEHFQMCTEEPHFKEMKYEEMSEIFGTSIGALKASYHHAVKKLRIF